MDPLTGTEPTRRGGDDLRAVGLAVGLTIAALGLSLVGGVAFLLPIILLGVDPQNTLVFIVLSAVGQFGFIAVGLIYVSRSGLSVPIAVPSAREFGLAAGGVFVALVGATLLSALLAALNLLPESVIEGNIQAEPRLLLALAALSVVLVAPAEEFLFRGVIQGRLRQSMGPLWAVGFASVLFGSLHLANFSGALQAVVAGAALISVTGAVFGVLYERTENLTVPIVAHACYNVVLLGLAYLTL